MRTRSITKPARSRWIGPILLVLAFLSLVPSRYAGVETSSAADDARQIAEESQKRTASQSERYEGLLQSFDAAGKVTEKRWNFERFGANGQSKSIIRFTAPAEVKGVALLVFNHPDRASDQWMWTPAIERDRRIALQDRSTRFFGTDFSFEDLEERDVNQYDYTLLGEETVDAALCWKIESTSKKTKSSQYTKSVVWFRKDNYVVARVESFVKDQVVRRLNNAEIRNVQGIWTAHELTMTDLRRGSRTRLALDKVQYNLPLKDEDFTLQAIRR
jgi:outer membrane lipoprotein-sorting protein